MKLTTKGRYAVTAMMDLAIHSNGHPISLAEISQRQDISLSYLEQLFSKLRKKKLVESMRGPGGGYQLSCEPADISVSDIIMAVDENTDITNCGGNVDCVKSKRCLTHDLWVDLSGQIQHFLGGISLADMKARGDVLEVAMLQKKKQKNKEKAQVQVIKSPTKVTR